MTFIKPRAESMLGEARPDVLNGWSVGAETVETLVTNDGRRVYQLLPTPNELALLNRGVPVTVTLYQNYLGLKVEVGGSDLREKLR